jgi:uncharacterized membrane protein YhaH (DUF805 family)
LFWKYNPKCNARSGIGAKLKSEDMNWFLKCLKQYADFRGRARRKEYWMFTLFCVIFYIVAMFLDNLLGITFTMDTGYEEVDMGYGWLYLLFTLFTLVPSLAVLCRRLHDIGKSGWWWLILLIPLAGMIWMLVLLCTDSKEENQYGSRPK